MTIFIIAHPDYNGPDYRNMRGILFISMGLAAVFPILHLIVVHGIKHCYQKMYVLELVILGGTYIFGAYLYVKRFPEKDFPGKFDMIGSSHNILHLCVVIATGILLWIIERMRYEKMYKGIHSKSKYLLDSRTESVSGTVV